MSGTAKRSRMRTRYKPVRFSQLKKHLSEYRSYPTHDCGGNGWQRSRDVNGGCYFKKLIGKREGGIVTYIHGKMSKRVFPPCFLQGKETEELLQLSWSTNRHWFEGIETKEVHIK